jgi:hypothetical protein
MGGEPAMEAPQPRSDGKWLLAETEITEPGCGTFGDFTGNGAFWEWGITGLRVRTENAPTFDCEIVGVNDYRCRPNLNNGYLTFNYDMQGTLLPGGESSAVTTMRVGCVNPGTCGQFEAEQGVDLPCTSVFQERWVHVPAAECEEGDPMEDGDPNTGNWAATGAFIKDTNTCGWTEPQLWEFEDWVLTGSTDNIVEAIADDLRTVYDRDGSRFSGDRVREFYGADWRIRVSERITGTFTAVDRMYGRVAQEVECLQGNCANSPAAVVPCETRFTVCARHVP